MTKRNKQLIIAKEVICHTVVTIHCSQYSLSSAPMNIVVEIQPNLEHNRSNMYVMVYMLYDTSALWYS